MNKKNLKTEDGSITVFLSIILLIIVVLTGTLVDGSRIYVAKSQLRRASQSAASSALANYDSKLKEQYGLFTINGENSKEMANTILYFTQKNLKPQDDIPQPNEIINYLNSDSEKETNINYMDLYNYSIKSDEVSVELMKDITQNIVLENQILEYMKYRAPKELMETFLKKLDILKKAGKTAEVIEDKVTVEDYMGDIGEKQNELAKKIIKINEFNKKEFQGLKKEILTGIKSHNEITDQIDIMKIQVEENMKKITTLEKEKKNTQQNIEDRNKDIKKIRWEIKKSEEEIKQLENNSKSKEEKNDKEDKIEEEKSTLNKKIDDLKKSIISIEEIINSLDKQNNEVTNRLNTLKEIVNKLEEEISHLESERAKEFEKIKKNYTSICDKLIQYNELNSYAINLSYDLVAKSLNAQNEVNKLKDNLNNPEKYKGKIILEAENQINKDIKNYNEKLKGVNSNFKSKNYNDGKIGDENFNLNKLGIDIRNIIKSKTDDFKKIIDNVQISKESTGLNEFIEEIATPIITNNTIISNIQTEMIEVQKEIDRIDRIINKDLTGEIDKNFNEKTEISFDKKTIIINNYSNSINYLKPKSEEKEDNKNKKFKDKMESRDTSLIDKDNKISSEYKNKEFLSSKGVSENINEEKFNELPSNQENKNNQYNSYFKINEETDSKLVKDSLRFVSNLTNGIEEGTIDFRNNLYINEYIMGTFRCGVDKKLVENNSNFTDFFGKYARSSYFSDKNFGRKDGEIEYILHGSPDPNKNLRYTKGQIYTIRVVMNLLHIFSDPDKMKFVTSISSSVAWIPIVAPIITTIIVFGWSSLESLFDLNDLMDGKGVPFYKISEGEWNLGVGGLKEHITDKVIEETTEVIEELVISFIDKMITMIFMEVEEQILNVVIEGEKSSEKMISDIKTNIEEAVDSALVGIPYESLRTEIKEIIIKPFFDNIDNKFQVIIEKSKNSTDDTINKVQDRVSSTIKEEIKKSLSPLKDNIREKLRNELSNNQKFKAFIKEKGDITLKEMSNKKFNVKFNYQDYLRIFLIAKDKNTKLRRIMDLIQLNIEENDKNFSIYNHYTMIKVDVISSIKYMFLSNKFFPEDLKLEEGTRHIIKSSVIEGY